MHIAGSTLCGRLKYFGTRIGEGVGLVRRLGLNLPCKGSVMHEALYWHLCAFAE